MPKIIAEMLCFPDCCRLNPPFLMFGEISGWGRQSCADFDLDHVNFDLDF
ncbi:MAG: hypothetical protein JGK31_28525 [Microcoleus sp. PH2017_30_WIL_O_A]|nr:hypothetical protein [Microcoleus sp. PH2017_30_WIL_O_A]